MAFYYQVEEQECNKDVLCSEHPIVFSMIDQIVNAREEFILTCRVHAYPEPSIVWMKDSTEIVPDSDRCKLLSSSLTPFLAI